MGATTDATRCLLWLFAAMSVFAGCGDGGDTDTGAATTAGSESTTTGPAPRLAVEDYVEAAMAATPAEQLAEIGEDTSRCTFTAFVEAMGLDELAAAEVSPSDFAADTPNAFDLGIEVDEQEAATLRAEVARCFPDPVERLIEVVLATPGAIEPAFVDTFADCFRQAVSVDQMLDDLVIDFVENARDDRPSDLAYFACAGTTDT